MLNILINLLNQNDCIKCKNCCKFTNNYLWDLPRFTLGEKESLSLQYPDIEFQRSNETYVPKTNIILDVWTCPFLKNNVGCILADKKPIDCALWPFYIMQNEDLLMLTQDLSCPLLNNTTIGQIEKSLMGVLTNLLNFYLNNSDYIQPYDNNYFIWKSWRRKDYENWNCF